MLTKADQNPTKSSFCRLHNSLQDYKANPVPSIEDALNAIGRKGYVKSI